MKKEPCVFLCIGYRFRYTRRLGVDLRVHKTSFCTISANPRKYNVGNIEISICTEHERIYIKDFRSSCIDLCLIKIDDVTVSCTHVSMSYTYSIIIDIINSWHDMSPSYHSQFFLHWIKADSCGSCWRILSKHLPVKWSPSANLASGNRFIDHRQRWGFLLLFLMACWSRQDKVGRLVVSNPPLGGIHICVQVLILTMTVCLHSWRFLSHK